MPDIATALNNLASAIMKMGSPRQVHILDPFIVTPTPTPQNVLALGNQLPVITKVSVIGFYVRSMGTATYIRVGTKGSIIDSLTQVQAYTEYTAPNGNFIDASEFFVISDTSDSVLEISGVRVD